MISGELVQEQPHKTKFSHVRWYFR